MKQLETEQLNLVIVRAGLKSLQPRDITIGDIDLIIDKIMPALNDVINLDVIKMYDKAETEMKELRKCVALGTIDEKDIAAKINVINKDIIEWENSSGPERSALKLEDSDYSKFSELIKERSKDWFNSIDKFYRFREDLELDK